MHAGYRSTDDRHWTASAGIGTVSVMTARQLVLFVGNAGWWGSGYVFVAIALASFSPGELVVARTALAAVALYAMIRLRDSDARAALSELRHRPGAVAALALTNNAVPYLLVAFGARHAPAGLVGVLMASTPIWTALLALRIDRAEAVNRRQALGLLVGLTGVALVIGLDAVHSLVQAAASAAVLIAAGCYALTGFVVKQHFADVPPPSRAFVSAGLSTLVVLPAGLTDGAPHVPTLQAWAALAVLAVGGTALSQIFYYRLIDEVGARRAAMTAYLAPAFSLLLGWIALGQSIAGGAVAGLALIALGMALASAQRPTASAAAHRRRASSLIARRRCSVPGSRRVAPARVSHDEADPGHQPVAAVAQPRRAGEVCRGTAR
jgi:drug/metabolite transporter (DMT)-like permease